MSAKKSADQWFAEYGENHQDPTNQRIHWVCGPTIFAGVLGFIWTIPVPESWMVVAPWFNWDLVAMAALMLFYVRLSPALSAGMFLFMSLCYTVSAGLDFLGLWPVWKLSAIAFVAGWIGQFIGHQIEGRRPSLGNEIVFLLIGPALLVSFVYRRLGQRY